MSRKSKAAEFLGEAYNLTVTGRNVLVTEAMQDYAVEKISKLEKFGGRIIDVNVTMDIQKNEHRVDISLKFNNVKIKSHAVSEDMYASLDKAVHKIEVQLLRYKSRINDHHAKNLAAVDMDVHVLAASDNDFVNDAIESANHQSSTFLAAQVINREKKTLKTLTVDEAIMKMELSGDQFLIFRSEEDRRLKVIYRRKDRNFGLIEVEA